jgi:3-hydroxyisobutyrate dehydrogenase
MVTDGPAVEQVAHQMLDELPAETVWLQTSTVGAAAADRLRELADAHRRIMVDAPVSGTTMAAERGQLTWLVSGPSPALEKTRPVLDSLGTRIIVAGDGQQANRLKLVVNAWMLSAAVGMADALAAAERLGLDRSTFLDVLRDGSLAMPYALNKAQAMTAADYRPGFPVELALKDLSLTTEALGQLPDLWRAAERRLTRAVAAGHARDDVGAVAAVAGTE